ncbi:hypothetical protein EDEG_03752 [Edhazardia aedis USNM 41457]|uniref:Uncharacterized protein n=1 Tax=Edhazardia aedis (strain USNM 41457) TaxID=1003232 RepID=J9DK39_EDHAE|nr:hypothetical protein EDEG_03752 [Edhazardia aedis USNM 41457]|eukprot:EJW01727.1 hypothetical protein EDEG_03752 [Edhazardia aedis USNM 41457]
MRHIVNDKKYLTNYGIEVLQKFSILVREKIYENIGGTVEGKPKKCLSELLQTKNTASLSEMLKCSQNTINNTIYIQVQDWSTKSKCDDDEKFPYDCWPVMNVIVGLIENENDSSE